MTPETDGPSPRLRQLLRGFPEPTTLVCARYLATGEYMAFDQALCGVIQHYLDQPPATDVVKMPGTTRLVADLGLDSLTMVEMIFLLEDLFGVQIPQEELIKVSTLDDLRNLLRGRLPVRTPADA